MPERKLWKAIVIEKLAQVSNYRIYSALTVFSVFLMREIVQGRRLFLKSLTTITINLL